MKRITRKWLVLTSVSLFVAVVGGASAALALAGGQPAVREHSTPGTPVSVETVPDWAWNRLGLVPLAPSSNDVARSITQEAAAAAAAKAYGAYSVKEAALVGYRSLGWGPSNLPAGPIWVIVLDKTPVFGAIGPQDAGKAPWTGGTVDLVLVDAHTGLALGEFATQVPADAR